MTSNFEEDIVTPTEEKKTPNDVQAVWISPQATIISLYTEKMTPVNVTPLSVDFGIL
jgi:hypothetical protein